MASLVLVAGLPSSGKSSVIRWLAAEADRVGVRTLTARVQCFDADPAPAEQATRVWSSGSECPDHFLARRLPEVRAWAEAQGATLLLVETAGLCGRCSPFTEAVVAVFVADLSMGRSAVQKVGPMLSTCDLCALTRVDRVSWSELVVQRATVREVNPDCAAVALNGLTGEGRRELWTGVQRRLASAGRGAVDLGELRCSPPQFYCSFCLGQTRVGISEL